ncbi:hypothetical protein ACJJTC_010485 [Scirpophaga incertulas]
MRREIFFLLALVGFNGAAQSYYSRSDGWSGPPDKFNISSSGDKISEEFWEWIGKRKEEDEKEIKILEELIEKKREEVKKEIAELVAKANDINTDKIESKDREVDNHLFHPCKNNGDDCIKQYLTMNSQCAPIYPYKNKHKIFREKSISYLPNFNLTLSITNSEIDGLDGKVEQFYINKKTGNLIYAVDFKSITIDSKMTYFIINQRGKEPVVVGDFVKIKFAPTVLTAVIPISYSGLSLKDALISADISGLPIYDLGPKASKTPDPVVQRTLLAYTINMKTGVRELFLTEAYTYFIEYLQNYICDFGIRT